MADQLPPLELSPSDDEPFQPSRAEVKTKVMGAYFCGAIPAEVAERIISRFLRED